MIEIVVLIVVLIAVLVLIDRASDGRPRGVYRPKVPPPLPEGCSRPPPPPSRDH